MALDATLIAVAAPLTAVGGVIGAITLDQTTRRSAGDASCGEARDRSEIARLTPTSGGLTMSDITTITGELVRAISAEEPA